MSKPSERWYSSGLSFACQPDCGACCTQHDDYAYVYLEGDDAARLADRLGITLAEFESTLTEMDGPYRVLRMPGPRCVFLDGTRCSVYEARPTQCRTFPFWKEILRSRRSWEALRSFCPGIGKGEVHSLPVILERIEDREG